MKLKIRARVKQGQEKQVERLRRSLWIMWVVVGYLTMMAPLLAVRGYPWIAALHVVALLIYLFVIVLVKAAK